MNAINTPAVRTVKETFHFRKFKDTPENRAAKLPQQADHPIEVETSISDDGAAMFQRKPETYSYDLPTAASLLAAEDKELAVVLDEVLAKAMKDAARVLVDAGKTLTAEVFNWPAVLKAEYLRLTTAAAGGSTSSGITADMLKAFSAKFVAYMKAAYPGDASKEAGAVATAKMINSRFGPAACAPYLKVLPKVVDNIELFFTDGLDEGEQEAYMATLEYLLAQADKVINPPAVDVESMF